MHKHKVAPLKFIKDNSPDIHASPNALFAQDGLA